MSYDYFLMALEQTKPQEIPTDKVLAIIKDYIIEKDETFVDLKFDESNWSTFYFETSASAINGLMVNRPCGHQKFVRCLYEIMKLGNFVFFEPNGKHPIITDPETEKHMPSDMIESLGNPVVATNWESFNSVFWNNR